MCGIAGYIDFKKSSGEEMLGKIAGCLTHRGPDGSGTYFTERAGCAIGLAHRRLSIIDLSNAASQPMHYDGLHLIFNGEIYNYNEIRERLLQLGHSFQTHSDSEVILHAWKEWGEDCIVQWRGMFAIALYDEKNGKAFFIRDRAGVKPFYYTFSEGLFLFGSELKSIVAHPAFKKEINPAVAASFLQFGYISYPYSIYKNTFKLSPGHILELDLQTAEQKITQYWNVYDCYNKPKLAIPLEEAIVETEKVLKESFDYRMVADVPVGVFLSGGYDSSCVTALLQKDRTEKIKTFTIGTESEALNEAPYAKKIAEHLGTDHTEYYCTAKEALEIIPQLPFFYDEPFADDSAIPTILVSRLARKKVTVALSADAGDEIFAGYNRYDFFFRYGRKVNAIPRPIRRLMALSMEKISSESIPYLKHKSHFHSRYSKVRNFLKNPSPGEMLKNLNHVFTDADIKNLFNVPVRPLQTAHQSFELKEEFYDPLSYMMAVDYQTYMVDDILQKVDRATMSVSLEGREPFLDQRIIEWAAQLPSEYKYRNGEKKYILKQIVHRHIPKEVMDRPKMGFAMPLAQWLAHDLKDLVMQTLSEKNLQKHGLLNVAEVQNVLREFYKGRNEKYLQVWFLLMFQMWYEKWMA